MSNLTSVMLCKHKKTKMKMVISATDSRYGHKQWISYVPCCAYCGKIVRTEDKP